MAKLNHVPHIKSAKASNDLQDPQHSSVFEVYINLPTAIQGQFKEDEGTLTEQVTKVTGLDALQKMPAAGSQKFFGADASFLNPTLETTYADLTIEFNLNIRKATDAWVLKIFKAWASLSYDMSDGTRTLMADYATGSIRVAEGNRDGTVFRSYIFQKIMITQITGLDDLDYTVNEARKLTVSFRSDLWDDDLA